MQTEHFLNPQGRERSILQLATQAKLPVGGNLVKEWYLIQVGVVILLVASCHTNWNKLRRIVGHLA